jgi:hypothetical protein
MPSPGPVVKYVEKAPSRSRANALMVDHVLPADPAAAWGLTIKAIFVEATTVSRSGLGIPGSDEKGK